jgi:hypothetical protein
VMSADSIWYGLPGSGPDRPMVMTRWPEVAKDPRAYLEFDVVGTYSVLNNKAPHLQNLAFLPHDSPRHHFLQGFPLDRIVGVGEAHS